MARNRAPPCLPTSLRCPASTAPSRWRPPVTAQRTAQDPSRESRPQSVATFQVPASSGDFCERGGRFGPHATNEEFGSPFYGKIVFISYFNAGVLAVDIRNPYNPQEVAFFI